MTYRLNEVDLKVVGLFCKAVFNMTVLLCRSYWMICQPFFCWIHCWFPLFNMNLY